MAPICRYIGPFATAPAARKLNEPPSGPEVTLRVPLYLPMLPPRSR